MQMNGAQALIKALELEGVEVIFGLPGGAILPVYDPIIDSPIRHILVRHEQGAGHMAEGYAQATGRPGVAMVTSGPAATNIVTPLCDAYLLMLLLARRSKELIFRFQVRGRVLVYLQTDGPLSCHHPWIVEGVD